MTKWVAPVPQIAPNTYDVNAVSLAKQLEVESVPDAFVVVAKHQVAGFDSHAIAEILSCTDTELQEVLDDPLYVNVRGVIAAIAAEQAVNQATGWDAIESLALQGLVQRMKTERDPEFLLKAAAIANRAQRRTPAGGAVLDPGLRAGRTTITLTQRIVRKISEKGAETTEETKQLSIKDGSMVNPSFTELDSLLSVRTVGVIPRMVEVKTHEPSVEEMLDDF